MRDGQRPATFPEERCEGRTRHRTFSEERCEGRTTRHEGQPPPRKPEEPLRDTRKSADVGPSPSSQRSLRSVRLRNEAGTCPRRAADTPRSENPSASHAIGARRPNVAPRRSLSDQRGCVRALALVEQRPNFRGGTPLGYR